jgi:hypothetical protein
MRVEDPDGTWIVLVEAPAGHPLRPRPAIAAVAAVPVANFHA